jgi:pyrroline-5-carboxylate reductase
MKFWQPVRMREILKHLEKSTSVRVGTSNAEAAEASPVVLLCAKPQRRPRLSGRQVPLRWQAAISIAAGLSVAALQKMAPK